VASFTLYIKQKGGDRESAEKAITLLKTYLPAVIAKQKGFDSSDAILVDDSTSPALLETDVIVYLVRNIYKSVISAKGGNVSLAENNDKVLGLTDLTLKISEVYFDRLYDGSAKELAGAAYHEAAHIKSNMDNSMHANQDGFLKASPDYNGNPTDSNNSFLANNLGRKLSMKSVY
jgi:hypothetical protein